MLYTPATKRALRYCLACHEGQLDKTSLPYALHPVHLAEQMDGEDETCVALLHDVMEDCGKTPDDLWGIGMSERVVEALTLLTHDPTLPYLDYVRHLRDNPVARAVKIADLRHNSQLARLDEVRPRDVERLRKYMEARVVLGDMAYELVTPAGSVRVLVNGEPYPFVLVDETCEEFTCCPSYGEGSGTDGERIIGAPDGAFRLEIETLPLAVGDVIEVAHEFGTDIVDYGSDERVDYVVYAVCSCVVGVGCYVDEEDDSPAANCAFAEDGRERYVIVRDPVSHRFYEREHVIPVRVAWKRGTEAEAAEIVGWVAGWGGW
ncbi:hypothetical protein [Collinsella tanakaei]|uniref:hypothetical protein n=1 Tax=Collinsella tanakaei TaxID=626935 RepID=UPI0025A3AD18|nr:hypothetical protein [Collinsella tanakaei]MDM8301664.1 hypothetical protein [Collinsella tanakaei]